MGSRRFNCGDIALLALRRNLPALLNRYAPLIDAADAFAEIVSINDGPYTLTATKKAFSITVNGVSFTGTLTAAAYSATDLATALAAGLTNASAELLSTVATVSAYTEGAYTRLKIRSKTAAAAGTRRSLKIEMTAANDGTTVVGLMVGQDSVEDGIVVPKGENYFWTHLKEPGVYRAHPGVFLREDYRETPLPEYRGQIVRVTFPMLMTQSGGHPLGVLNATRRLMHALQYALYENNTLNNEVVHAFIEDGWEVGAGEKVESSYLAGAVFTLGVDVAAYS